MVMGVGEGKGREQKAGSQRGGWRALLRGRMQEFV